MTNKISKKPSKFLIKQLIKYAFVGAIGTIINISILYVFTEYFEIHYIISEIIAFIAASINNYILDKIWTFKENIEERIVKKYFQFLTISIISFLFNISILFILVEFYDFWYIIAELIAIICAFLINFICNKLWTFHEREEKDDEDILLLKKEISDNINPMIFLPTYNEKENIGEILDIIKELPFKKEILIVDDNSTDGTLNIIKEKNTKYSNIKLIIRKGKKGRGLAGITALKYFINSNCNVLVELDADFSHHPKYIPNFLRLIPKYDVIIGSRLIKGGGEQGRTLKRFIITLIANIIIRFLFRTRIKDCTSGFRAFKKEVIQSFNLETFISVDYSITEEILYACILNKVKIKEIPIIFYEREGGESKLNFKKIFYSIIGILKIIYRGNKIIIN